MAKVTGNFWDDFPPEWKKDIQKWQLMMSIVEAGKHLEDLASIQIVPQEGPNQNLDILLKSLQQSILEVDRANGSLQEQNQVLVSYLKKANAEIKELREKVDKLSTAIRRKR